MPSGKIDKHEYLTDEEILLTDQGIVIEQAKLAHSLLGKAFKKQTKTIEDQGKKQIEAIEDHGKQLAESNKLIKKDFNIEKDSIPFYEQKKLFNELIEGRSSGFRDIEK